ncbi:hypothetical protein D7030_07150 [Flavobacteriaceae bacterium AU392]|nr:hypothetical protein D1817_01270 [Flavobacteriaceae bacterium]RKM84903.1 hypothetical protein D7030_07150 [Flavobacteriaceae bacterium AU392]
MTAFKDLKSQWDSQPKIEVPKNGLKQIIEKVVFVKNKQRITNIVLGTTIVVLCIFFFYITAYNNTLVSIALLLMIGALIIRICVERFSIKLLKQLDITIDSTMFRHKMIDYYKKRVKIHYILTPILILMYIIGFILLLPFFKEALSIGFYNYIKISGLIILIILSFFIRKQILKELLVLKELYN